MIDTLDKIEQKELKKSKISEELQIKENLKTTFKLGQKTSKKLIEKISSEDFQIDSEKTIDLNTEMKHQILNENTKSEINKIFQNEFEKSLNKGFPLKMLINDTIIQLNPDNTYKVKPHKKRELNTIKNIYLK